MGSVVAGLASFEGIYKSGFEAAIVTKKHSSLTITRVQREDEAAYLCAASLHNVAAHLTSVTNTYDVVTVTKLTAGWCQSQEAKPQFKKISVRETKQNSTQHSTGWIEADSKRFIKKIIKRFLLLKRFHLTQLLHQLLILYSVSWKHSANRWNHSMCYSFYEIMVTSQPRVPPLSTWGLFFNRILLSPPESMKMSSTLRLFVFLFAWFSCKN